MSDSPPPTSEAQESVPNIPNPQDELIIKQQEAIEKEIMKLTPLISEKEPITSLLKEYTSDSVYQSKIGEIGKAYEFIRRTRPDGNCFFRAYCYSILEALIKTPQIRNTFRNKILEAKQLLADAGYTQFTVQDFYDNFLEMVDRVLGELPEAQLYTEFQDQGVSDYLVVFLRILTSAELRKNADFYQNFLEGGQTVEEFCQLEVEPMYKESDHIHIIALTSALSFGVRVVYMDRGLGAKHDFPEGSTPTVHLLYRPGHYDVIYLKN